MDGSPRSTGPSGRSFADWGRARPPPWRRLDAGASPTRSTGSAIASRPFFRQGPSALTKLVFFSALALFLMVADGRFKLIEPLRAGLSAWVALSAGVPASAGPLRRRARAFLLPDPARGGACKRSLLLARWCVRPDDGIDLGLWTGTLSPRDLLVPLDTHVHRVVRQLRLTRRRAPDWKAAVEVTRGLAAYDPDDPTRFDFALARPGIVGACRHRHVPEICAGCDLRTACRLGTPRAPRTRAPTRADAVPTSRRRTSGSS